MGSNLLPELSSWLSRACCCMCCWGSLIICRGRLAAVVLLAAVLNAAGTAAAVPAACSTKISQESGKKFTLKADVSTVHWGYFL
jgi:hypothetical protein